MGGLPTFAKSSGKRRDFADSRPSRPYPPERGGSTHRDGLRRPDFFRMQSVFSASLRRAVFTERFGKEGPQRCAKNGLDKPWHGWCQLWGSNGAGDGEPEVSSGAKLRKANRSLRQGRPGSVSDRSHCISQPFSADSRLLNTAICEGRHNPV
jgi:hypothetical protein